MSGSYIVVLKNDAGSSDVDAVLSSVNVTPKHKYDMGTFKGFAADLTDQQLEAVLANPKVDYFEADGVVSAFAAANPKKK